MARSVSDVIDSILAKKIDKQEALRSFESLSDEEKNQLIADLKFKLPGNDTSMDDAEGVGNDSASVRLLKSIHEMNLTEHHGQYIAALSQAFEKYVPKSKANALKHQKYFVDQRKTAGLKRSLKSVQFQLTYERAEGPYIIDIDGNQYIDIAGDNGVNLFGHQPEFMTKALIARMHKGNPLVGYSEDLFQAAKLFCELTGHERMVFAQSGTESVMWAVRIARAATTKKKIVIFDGSYHGLSDAVLAFKDRKGNSMSAGLGMLQEFADQLMILDYGNMDHLNVIEQHADSIACVLTEPVQSRFPSRQPVEFLKELRKITLEKDIVLIFDEMITGFRAGCKGAEGFYNVKPDMATYGKVAGGGMPTGIIAGLAKYMNYVDGGTWNFDDGSMPSLKRTMMAGTHTQNSLKVAATLAICTEMKSRCTANGDCNYHNCFVHELNKKVTHLAVELNKFFAEKRVPVVVDYFSSLFRIQIIDDPFGLVRELFIVLLKMHGIETSTSGNCFITTTHTDEHIETIIDAVKKSVQTLLDEGFFVEAEEEDNKEGERNTSGEKTAGNPREREGTSAIKPSPDTANPYVSHQAEQLKALILADLQSFQARGN